MNNDGVRYQYTACFPERFFQAEVNERFVAFILEELLKVTFLRHGDPVIGEPDLIFEEGAVEVTLACNRNTTDSYIRRLQRGDVSSDDVEQDVIRYLRESIAAKATKSYCIPEVTLCVLIPIELYTWVGDAYGSRVLALFSGRRDECLQELRNRYIETQVFDNILILFPDLSAKWWVFDLASNRRASYQLSFVQFQSGEYPFFIEQSTLDYLVKIADDG